MNNLKSRVFSRLLVMFLTLIVFACCKAESPAEKPSDMVPSYRVSRNIEVIKELPLLDLNNQSALDGILTNITDYTAARLKMENRPYFTLDIRSEDGNRFYVMAFNPESNELSVSEEVSAEDIDRYCGYLNFNGFKVLVSIAESSLFDCFTISKNSQPLKVKFIIPSIFIAYDPDVWVYKETPDGAVSPHFIQIGF